MIRTAISVLLVGPLTLLVLLTGPLRAPAAADDDRVSRHSGKDRFSEQVAGTYLLRFDVAEDEIFLRLATLTADGNWFSIDAHQQADSLGFSDQQGVWERTSRREVTATVLDFDYNPDDGEPVGVARLRFVVRFTPNLQEVSGEVVGKVFQLDEDPLDPDVPLDEFGATFTGRRVTVIVTD